MSHRWFTCFAVAAALFGCTARREATGQAPLALRAPSEGMSIVSPAFKDGQPIPVKYGCSGQSISPPLVFKGIPANAKSLALIVTDPDAPGGLFTHWVAWNVLPTVTTVSEATPPSGAIEGQNSYGKSGWGPPCPPSGSHRYVFDLYALDVPLPADTTRGREAIESAMSGHIVAQAKLVGTYRR